MSEAIEAAADAMHADDCPVDDCDCSDTGYYDRLARIAISVAWPILSAPLREMHVYHECDDFRECSILFGGMCAKTDHCSHCRYAMPCPTMQEILDIDKELGLTDG